jgi:hypothetical protein
MANCAADKAGRTTRIFDFKVEQGCCTAVNSLVAQQRALPSRILSRAPFDENDS